MSKEEYSVFQRVANAKERSDMVRDFSDLTLKELDDYTACFYEIVTECLKLEFDDFYLNRLEKKFTYRIASYITNALNEGLTCESWELWQQLDLFFKYIFRIKGGNDFVRNVCSAVPKNSDPRVLKRMSKEDRNLCREALNFFSFVLGRALVTILFSKSVSDRVKEFFRELKMVTLNEDGTICTAPTEAAKNLWNTDEFWLRDERDYRYSI